MPQDPTRTHPPAFAVPATPTPPLVEPAPAPDPAPEPEPPTPATEPDPAVAADVAEARIAASRGAQVVLDPDSDAALAARGAMGATIEENTAVLHADLIAQGLDPISPSGEASDKPEPSDKPDSDAEA